jgi:hypothetical protein
MDFSADNLITHKISAGETLTSIAEEHGCEVADLATCNFGYDDEATVARGLFEIVGTSDMVTEWETYVFEGDEDTRGTGEILVPDDDLVSDAEVNQSHEFVVSSPMTPAGVEIKGLDKWFVPGDSSAGGESCQIKYHVHGDEFNPTFLNFQVYASNYCELGAADDTKPLGNEFTVLEDEPIYLEDLGEFPPNVDGSISWDGKATTTKGILAPSATGSRYANVALSPYTVLLRYCSDPTETDAAILLDDFWPQWEGNVGARSVVTDSLAVRWTIKNCGDGKLTHGQLVIFDKNDDVVYRLALGGDKVANDCDHEHGWDGVLSDGSTLREDQMPYRVQIQAHSDKDETQGLALAAMHTEVRMYVDQEAVDKGTDQAAMSIELGEHAATTPSQADSTKWAQYQLSAGGFHPGPVDGTSDVETKRAVKEFQRCHAKEATAPFSRLPFDGGLDQATLDALARLPPDQRSCFAELSTKADISWVDAQSKFNNPGEDFILWLHDDNYYNNFWNTEIVRGKPHQLEGYRPSYGCGDAGLTPANNECLARPWLPLITSPRILSRDTSGEGVASKALANLEDARNSVGPVRVDWYATDVEPDYANIDTSDVGYDKTKVRTFTWVQTETNRHLDEEDGEKYYNCPQSRGGLRPGGSGGGTNVASYMHQLFGGGTAQSMKPWLSKVDDSLATACTVVHSDVGQAAADIDANAIGHSGLYFRPSNIAGDGYRLHTRVSFDDCQDGPTFPNWESLAKRYPEAPSGRSAQFTLWKRAKMRGLVQWTAEAAPDPVALSNPTLAAAFVHLVATGQTYASTPLVDATDFTNTWQRHVTDSTYAGLTPVLKTDYIWPFCDEERYGVPVSEKGETISTFLTKVLLPAVKKVWKDKFQEGLADLLVESVERNHGKLDGTIFGMAHVAPEMTYEEYRCSLCHDTQVEVTDKISAGNSLVGKGCEDATCKAMGGVMEQHSWFECNACTEFDHSRQAAEEGRHIKLGSPCKVTGCTGTLVLNSVGPSTKNYSRFSGGSVAYNAGFIWIGECHFKKDSVWPHEYGHCRHLQHSEAHLGAANSPGNPDASQHDSTFNPNLTFGLPAKDDGWDQTCTMSYTPGDRFFCGKCVMKLRGWTVENASDPPQADKDA